MKYIETKLTQFEQWILSIIMWRSFGKKTVHMKNGKKFYLSQGNANSLEDSITKGSSQFQSFCDDKNLVIMINMKDVSYID